MNSKKISLIIGCILCFLLLAVSAHGASILEGASQSDAQALYERIHEKYRDKYPIPSTIGLLGDTDNQFAPSPFADAILFFADADYLYCIYLAEIDASLERGRLVKRDQDTQSDMIDFKIITQPNQLFAYGFQASPGGVMSDYTLDTAFNGDWSWNSDAILSTEVSSHYWLSEFRIPWHDLRMDSHPPYTIGVYVSRFCYQGKKSYRYPHIQYSSGPFFFQNGSPIVISNPIHRQWRLRADAYYAALYDAKEERGNIWYKNVGGNISVKPSSNSSLKLSIKPDFSDTPLDSAVDNYNSKNPPQIAENRAFFLEDYDLLSVSRDLWYTRNIISPIFACRYSSVSQDQAVALLLLRDDPGNTLSDGDFFNALGYSRTFSSSKVNLNLYGRQNIDYHNEMAHAAFSFRPSNSWEISPIGNISYLRQDSLSLVGYGAGVTITNTQAYYTLSLASNISDKNFRADMGAFYDQDSAQNSVGFVYDKPRNGIVSRIRSSMNWHFVNSLSSGDAVSTNGNYTQALYLDKNSYVLTMATNYREEKYQDKWFQPYSFTVGFNSINSSSLTSFASISTGKDIIYSLAETSPILSCNGSVTMNFNEKLWFSYDITYMKFSRPKLNDWDSEYNLMNIKNYIAILRDLSISQGLSLINYNLTISPDREYLGNLGYYINLDWRFGRNYHVCAGYKSQYSRYTVLSESDLITDASNFYLKIQLGL